MPNKSNPKNTQVAIFADNIQEYYDKMFSAEELIKTEVVGKIFDNCHFIRCDFHHTIFKDCKFCDCTFEQCNLAVIKVVNCKFNEVNFLDSKITGVNWAEAYWPSIKLISPICFERCDISFSSFWGLILPGIKIIECKCHEVDFRESDLSNADFGHSDLLRSQFINCDLSGASFLHAENYQIDVKVNKLKKAKFMLPEAAALLNGLDIELVE